MRAVSADCLVFVCYEHTRVILAYFKDFYHLYTIPAKIRIQHSKGKIGISTEMALASYNNCDLPFPILIG